MAFDKSLDKEIWKKEIIFDTTKIIVAVMRYDKSPAKVQIGRENRTTIDHDFRFAKLGRLTQEETKEVIPELQNALIRLEEYNEKQD